MFLGYTVDEVILTNGIINFLTFHIYCEAIIDNILKHLVQ